MTKPDSFTIRVYGLLIVDHQVLLSRENIYGNIYTKFPGGGLELGEGVVDCLEREMMEEAGIRIIKWELFHINEHFLASTFHKSKQVLSIYYRIWSDEISQIKTSNPEDSTILKAHSDQLLYWASLNTLTDEPIHLPVDREVVRLISQRNKG